MPMKYCLLQPWSQEHSPDYFVAKVLEAHKTSLVRENLELGWLSEQYFLVLIRVVLIWHFSREWSFVCKLQWNWGWSWLSGLLLRILGWKTNKPCSVEKSSAPRGEEGKRGNMRGNTQQVCFPKEVVDGLEKKKDRLMDLLVFVVCWR